MSRRLQRIKKIVELAEMELDKAAQTYAYMQTRLADAKQQLESLLLYCDEYAKKPSSVGQISPIQLQTHNAFSEKLSQAVVAQKNQVEESEKMLVLSKEAWIEKRARVKSLEALYKRISNNEQAILNRAEQRMLDELSAQKYIQNQKISH
ncbi:flagellar export protein FliJ [Thiomicrorhabdus sp.]|uniref:flagellar export protein FliJ n=1 Tax=Thiomicrorhabdus sp. TaxID=2039724 RepID=UPI002AA708A1|nr:flagellar export protein FliJ [Thiomicrorhabdus sp.]